MRPLLENLKAIRNGERNEAYGICGSLPHYQAELFLQYAQDWPKCGRYYFLPNYFAHKNNGTLWQGEQLQLRLELLDFVIGELEK